MKKVTIFLFNLPKLIIIWLIDCYQILLSPDHSWLKLNFPHGYCLYYPSCSEYSKQAITKFGLIQGVWLGFIRLLKCHPWSEPKVDPIPNS